MKTSKEFDRTTTPRAHVDAKPWRQAYAKPSVKKGPLLGAFVAIPQGSAKGV